MVETKLSAKGLSSGGPAATDFVHYIKSNQDSPETFTSYRSPIGDLPVGYPFPVAVSDEITELAADTAVITFRSPEKVKVLALRASLAVASTSGLVTIDVNISGVTMLSTKLTIDQDGKTSFTAATPVVISDDTWDDDEEITVDIDGAGVDAKGLKLTFYLEPAE